MVGLALLGFLAGLDILAFLDHPCHLYRLYPPCRPYHLWGPEDLPAQRVQEAQLDLEQLLQRQA